MDIIDTHMHLLYPEKFEYPWIKENNLEALDGRFAVEDYQTDLGRSVEVRSIVMEVDVKEEDQADEAGFFSKLSENPKSGIKAVVASGRPENPGFAKQLDALGHPSLKGIRRVFHVLDPLPLGETFTRNVRLLGERNLVFDICARPEQLQAISGSLVVECPDTRFVLDHCGNPPISSGDLSQWEAGIEALARTKNVFCKVSGLVTQCEKGKVSRKVIQPVFNHVLDLFGPDRILFGGDWPVCNLTSSIGEWIQIAGELVGGLSASEKEAFWRLNAEKIYNVK